MYKNAEKIRIDDVKEEQDREKEKKEILGKAALLNGGGGVDSDRIGPTKKDKSTTWTDFTQVTEVSVGSEALCT